MQPLRICKILGLVSALGLISSIAFGATISGKVTGPDGAPFRAAFVQARNSKTRATVIVLFGNDGKYRAENLPAGDYQVLARATGYRSDPKSGIVLSENQNATFDWTLQKQMVHWDEIPIIQGIDLFPEGPGKDKFAHCGSSCHGFQQFINVRQDENGWREVLKDQMSTRIGGSGSIVFCRRRLLAGHLCVDQRRYSKHRCERCNPRHRHHAIPHYEASPLIRFPVFDSIPKCPTIRSRSSLQNGLGRDR